MPDIGFFAPEKTGYAFDGYYSQNNNKKYYEMRVMNDEETARLNLLDEAMVEKIVPIGGLIWNISSNTKLYGRWENNPLECDSTYAAFCDSQFNQHVDVHLVHGKTKINPISIDGYEFDHFTYLNRNYSKDDYINTQLYRGYSGNIYLDGTIAAYYTKSCVATGTLITLADGRQVPVEQLTGSEMLLVWNLHTGRFDTAPILFIDSDPVIQHKVINLTFSDGTTVKVISEHGFWDINLNKYVYLDENASQYIGHWFNKQTDDCRGYVSVQLVNVVIDTEFTATYSPVTYGHLCYYVNGMLSMPGGISGLFNIFEVDGETMTYNATMMAEDIANYGLFTYEEFSLLIPISEDVFNAINAQYFKVAIGKGMVTVEQLANLYQRYAEFLD